MYWTRLRKTADQGSNVIHLEEAVDWKPGEEIVIAPTSFEPYDTEVLSIGMGTDVCSFIVELETIVYMSEQCDCLVEHCSCRLPVYAKLSIYTRKDV